jgi:hypothetical protein
MSVRVMSMVYAAHFQDITFIHEGKKKTGEEYKKTVKVLNCNLKSVCLALADNTNDEGEGSYAGLETLSSKTELSEVTVIACLEAMKKEQIIFYVGRSKWHTCNYTVNKAKLAEMATWKRQKREKPQTKAALVSKVKPLQPQTKAALENPSLHPNPSINDESKPAVNLNEEAKKAIEKKVGILKELYEQNIGAATPLLMGMFRNAALTYSQDWYQPAFEVMLKSAKHRSWNFVETVLEGWRNNGYGWKPEYKTNGKAKPNGNNQPSNPPAYTADDYRIAAEIRAERGLS